MRVVLSVVFWLMILFSFSFTQNFFFPILLYFGCFCWLIGRYLNHIASEIMRRLLSTNEICQGLETTFLISILWLTYRAVWSPARWKCSEEIWVEKWWEPEVILVHLSSSYMRSVWNLFPERVINLHSITHYLCFLLSLVCCLFACAFCYLKLLYYLIAFFISLSLFFVLALLCDGVFRNNSFHSISLFMFFIICLHQLLRQASYHFCVKQEGKKRKKSARLFDLVFLVSSVFLSLRLIFISSKFACFRFAFFWFYRGFRVMFTF